MRKILIFLLVSVVVGIGYYRYWYLVQEILESADREELIAMIEKKKTAQEKAKEAPPQFLNEFVGDELIAWTYAAHSRFLYVDLTRMRIKVFEHGVNFREYPILSIRDFGQFATPVGNFKALTKEEKHFSSIGRVWMPWSIQFYGNYFIHGWPYYPDGTDVAPGYSGGCVRLATEDAKALYDFVREGMPIVIVK